MITLSNTEYRTHAVLESDKQSVLLWADPDVEGEIELSLQDLEDLIDLIKKG